MRAQATWEGEISHLAHSKLPALTFLTDFGDHANVIVLCEPAVGVCGSLLFSRKPTTRAAVQLLLVLPRRDNSSQSTLMRDQV